MKPVGVSGFKRGLAYVLALLMMVIFIWLTLGHSWRTERDKAERGRADGVHVFAGVQGPDRASVIKPESQASWRSYEEGGPAHLAILLTDPRSAWMGLVQGLRTMGVPFVVTQDVALALRHRVVLVYPTISGKVLPAESLRALARHPAQGGSLLGFLVEGGGLQEVFGFSEVAQGTRHHQVQFDRTQALTNILTEERELTVPFASARADDGTNLASVSYQGATQALARYEDGTVAMTSRQVGAGHAYALGVDLGALFLIGQNNREQGVARAYVNQYEPAMDVWLRLLKRLYELGEPQAVTLSTVPHGAPLAVVMSHDIDYTRSIVNASAYAAFEASNAVPATYFIQTKYVRDWNDQVFFNALGVEHLRKVHGLGQEIASHSVAHSQVFHRAELGSGQEQYPGYQPFVHDAQKTDGMSVLGELRVSRFLLTHFLPGYEVSSFRPGHLKDPYSLPQALEATGYRYSSSVTANNSLTHLPFRLTYGREGRSPLPVFEFPVTVEDEALPRLGERVQPSLDLARQLSTYGGLMMVLIHTDVMDHKLAFEKAFVAALKDKAWFGSLKMYGDFWAARDAVRISATEPNAAAWRLTLDAPMPLQGLTLTLPDQVRVKGVEPGALTWRQEGRKLILDAASGVVRIHLTTPPAAVPNVTRGNS